MAAAATINEVFDHGQVIEVVGTIAFTGNYTTGGDTLSLASAKVPSSEAPIDVDINGKAGFVYQFDKGTTLANGKVLVFCNTAGAANAALGEHTAVALVAGVTGDTVRFRALFKKLV